MAKRFSQSVRHAFDGLIAAFTSERHMRIHGVVALLVIALGILLPLSTNEWLWVALCITLVISAELINTALEALTDLATPDYHPLAKKTKDIAAGTVVLCVVFAIIVGFIVFLPKIMAFAS